MTGRPDTTDPLDRIEALVEREEKAAWRWTQLATEDARALVAVARAAREIVEAQTGPRWKRLAEELARLDGAR